MSPDAPHTAAAAERPPAKTPGTPYWLLWSTGAAALVLALAAFWLWGTGGAAALIDMIVAFCS